MQWPAPWRKTGRRRARARHAGGTAAAVGPAPRSSPCRVGVAAARAAARPVTDVVRRCGGPAPSTPGRGGSRSSLQVEDN
eukprot:1997570-Heterocapsa_arctica.AAC.1